jgi:glycosyltransferase involved in cell wall biosynthesis
MKMQTGQHDVLQVLPNLETGGAEKMVFHLAGELSRAGVSTGVVSFYDLRGSQLERALEAISVPVWGLGKRPGPDPRLIGNFRSLIRRLQPKVVHTHLAALRYAVPALTGIKNPPDIVHTIHRIAERDSEVWLRWLQRWCMERCTQVIAVSEEVANSCARVYRKLHVPVILNGIPIREFAGSQQVRHAIRHSLGIDEERFVFCCVGRLRTVKNHKGLLEAFRGVAHRTEAHLLLAGDGELRGELETMARTMRITPWTHFLGEREDIDDILAASDAFILPSFSEGTPMSMLEAMAAGLPVIATAVGGVPEIVRNGTEGMLVPSGDTDALRDAMMRIIAGENSRRVMSISARARVKQAFSASAMAKSYLSLYGRLEARLAVGAV